MGHADRRGRRETEQSPQGSRKPTETVTSSLDTKVLDDGVQRLRRRASTWAALPLDERIELAERTLVGVRAVADAQVATACQHKGLDGDREAGEEYLGGPVVVARNLRLLIGTLREIRQKGAPHLPKGTVRVRDDGQVVVRVLPSDSFERLLYPGFCAEVWMDPVVTPSTLPEEMAGFYRGSRAGGKVVVVLGGGNVASICAQDVLYKLFVEGHVCLLKLHPVNEYLEPFLAQAFSELIEAGFLQIVRGGRELGAYLCSHPGVDQVHMTGSDKTHDAIVYGLGAEGHARKLRDDPISRKPFSAELGNVSPVIVVPGRWGRRALRFQAESIATQITNNCGFNCNAARVLVTSAQWSQREALLAELKAVLHRVPTRQAYYPGAAERHARFVAAHPRALQIGQAGNGRLPWTLITGIDSGQHDEICFREEAFCGVLAETNMAASSPMSFLERAVAFCNQTLWGTLSASIVVDPVTARRMRQPLDLAVAKLRYGTVAINHWPAVGYGFGCTTWGAFPGHTRSDIQSGTGVVHNARMFDRPQKSVVKGPFWLPIKLPWFATHHQQQSVARQMVRMEADPRLWLLPGIFSAALRG